MGGHCCRILDAPTWDIVTAAITNGPGRYGTEAADEAKGGGCPGTRTHASSSPPYRRVGACRISGGPVSLGDNSDKQEKGEPMTDTTLHEGPLEFDPFSDEYFNGPYDLYRRLRDEAPVLFNEKYGFWALFRYDGVARPTRTGDLLERPRRRSLHAEHRPGDHQDVPLDHHDGPPGARPAEGPGQPGVHPQGHRFPRADGPRRHRLVPLALRPLRLVRCGG